MVVWGRGNAHFHPRERFAAAPTFSREGVAEGRLGGLGPCLQPAQPTEALTKLMRFGPPGVTYCKESLQSAMRQPDCGKVAGKTDRIDWAVLSGLKVLRRIRIGAESCDCCVEIVGGGSWVVWVSD